MNIAVTGACGLIGREILRQAARAGIAVTAFDVPTRKNRHVIKGLQREYRRVKAAGHITPVWGDIRNLAAVERAVRNTDAVIHLAALIPPAADRNAEITEQINVGGTQVLCLGVRRRAERNPRSQPIPIVAASSISIYGDRRGKEEIGEDTELDPSPGDMYAVTKIAVENCLRESGVPWTILRLTYIVSPEKIQRDPLMFRMPLDTPIEICHVRDAAAAFIAAVREPQARGRVFNIAGGQTCRTNFGEYLQAMFGLFGLKGIKLPSDAFSTEGYHCGFMDTTDSQKLLSYQSVGFDEYYREVSRKTRFVRPWARLFRKPIIAGLLKSSPYIPKPVRVSGKPIAHRRLLPASS